MTPGRRAGRRAIVTGAASGIGRATLRLFVQEGSRVLVVDGGLSSTHPFTGARR
jgi:3-oxoacyl-[acyl-carrier protein] reductase